MSEAVRFAAGEVVFREGEPSRGVLLVEGGDVEVVKAAASGGGGVLLGRIGAGEFAGEMGVLEGRPRSATVRAGAAGAAGRMLDREAFLEAVSRDSALALNALRRLSERLHAADERLAGAAGPTTMAGGSRAGAARATILAGSGRLASVLPGGGVEVDALPFTVGRNPAPGQERPDRPVRLGLDDAAPYRLSREHFAIVEAREGGGGLAVADDRSTLGTVVNGEAVGEPFPRSRAPLRAGENLVVAGGAGSPFAFRVLVGEG